MIKERERDNNKGINSTKISVNGSFSIRSAYRNCKYKLNVLNIAYMLRQMLMNSLSVPPKCN